MTSPDTKPKAEAGAVEVLRSNLLRYVGRAEDWAGSLPAKEAVKLRPSDWHAVCDTARALAAALQSSSSAEADLRAERDALRAENERLREALRPFADWRVSFLDVSSHAILYWDAKRYLTVGDFRRARAALDHSKWEDARAVDMGGE